MRNLPFSTAFLVLAACSPGDAGLAGNPESKTYDYKDFKLVKAETAIDLRLNQGPFVIAAESRNADLSQLKFELRGDELLVSSSSRFTLSPSPTYLVSITAPTFTAIDASAGVKITGENLTLEDVEIDGSTGVQGRLSGVCKSLMLSASTGSSIDASALKCAKATVSAAVGAKVVVHGHPPQVQQNAAASGKVEMAD